MAKEVELTVLSGSENDWKAFYSGSTKKKFLEEIHDTIQVFKGLDRFIKHRLNKLMVSPHTEPKGMKYHDISQKQSDLRLWVESFRPPRERSSKESVSAVRS